MEKVCSILVQLEYKHQIKYWEMKETPFKLHIHVPEVHPLTGLMFCECEDEGHVLKVLMVLTCIHNMILSSDSLLDVQCMHVHIHIHGQCIGSYLRRRATREIHLELFVQALEDPFSGLT